MRRAALFLIPLALIAGLVVIFFAVGGARIFPGDFPPVEDVTIGRVTLNPGEVEFVVTNGGPSPVTIAQVLVDDAYWEHEIEPSREIKRLRSARVTLKYPWVETEPIALMLMTESGVTFEHEIAVATSTPEPGLEFLWIFALLGIYIGVLPVAMGMTFMPLIRTLSRRWLSFLLAFSAGVLVFLAIETLFEAAENAEGLPTAFGGVGVVSFAAIVAFSLLMAASTKLKNKEGTDRRFLVALTVAAGIGLHNLGEGLAVGAAYRLGEIALGAFLVIGFALHNTTEGIGIVSILGDRKTPLPRLIVLGLIAGVPTIAGGWIGGVFFSPTLAAVFLAVAAGAIAQVVYDVMLVVKEETPLTSPESILGIASGVAVMYLTGILVAA